MNNKKILILVSVFLLVLLGIFSYIYFNIRDFGLTVVKNELQNKNIKENERKNEAPEGQNGKTLSKTDEDSNLYERAKNEKNALLCKDMNIPDNRNLCVKNIALNLLDSSICDFSIDEIVGSRCVDSVFFAIAQNNSDLAACQRIKDRGLKISCIQSISGSITDPDSCALLEKDMQVFCTDGFLIAKAIESSDADKCSEILGENRHECFSYFFSQLNNLNECDEFVGAENVACIKDVSLRLAIAEQNKEKCAMISDEASKNYCIEMVESREDADGDGLSFAQEKIFETDPNNKDTDNDGLSDFEEIDKYKTNPLSNDTDEDGYSDGDEVREGYNPNGV